MSVFTCWSQSGIDGGWNPREIYRGPRAIKTCTPGNERPQCTFGGTWIMEISNPRPFRIRGRREKSATIISAGKFPPKQKPCLFASSAYEDSLASLNLTMYKRKFMSRSVHLAATICHGKIRNLFLVVKSPLRRSVYCCLCGRVWGHQSFAWMNCGALWDISDDSDVFMDAMNRKTTMALIVCFRGTKLM